MDINAALVSLFWTVISGLIVEYISRQSKENTEYRNRYVILAIASVTFSLLLFGNMDASLALIAVTMILLVVILRKLSQSLVRGYLSAVICCALSIGICGSSVGMQAKVIQMAFREITTEFNTHPKDFDLLRVCNITAWPDNVDANAPGIWNSSILAAAGDTVELGTYYHNCSTRKAEDVYVRLFCKQKGSTIFCTASLKEGFLNTTTLGSALIAIKNLNGNATYSLDQVSTKWFPDQRMNDQILPYDQTGLEVNYGSGLNIGDIENGPNHYGFVIVRYVLRENIRK